MRRRPTHYLPTREVSVNREDGTCKSRTELISTSFSGSSWFPGSCCRSLDFQDETLGAKLGAKVGAEQMVALDVAYDAALKAVE